MEDLYAKVDILPSPKRNGPFIPPPGFQVEFFLGKEGKKKQQDRAICYDEKSSKDSSRAEDTHRTTPGHPCLRRISRLDDESDRRVSDRIAA